MGFSVMVASNVFSGREISWLSWVDPSDTSFEGILAIGRRTSPLSWVDPSNTSFDDILKT